MRRVQTIERQRAAAEEDRVRAKQGKAAAEADRVNAADLRTLLDGIRQEREALHAAEAERVASEQKRVLAEVQREAILTSLRETAETLDAAAAKMKGVEEMRQALYSLVGTTRNERQ